jgi:hypothetical protein
VTGVDGVAADYRVAFLRFLPRREEAALAAGYELGRASVGSGISILELARVHHEVLRDVLHDTPVAEVADVAMAASNFFLEVLAAYDLAQRSFRAQAHHPAASRPRRAPAGGSDAQPPGS